jgi:hypothetical protein
MVRSLRRVRDLWKSSEERRPGGEAIRVPYGQQASNARPDAS